MAMVNKHFACLRIQQLQSYIVIHYHVMFQADLMNVHPVFTTFGFLRETSGSLAALVYQSFPL